MKLAGQMEPGQLEALRRISLRASPYALVGALLGSVGGAILGYRILTSSAEREALAAFISMARAGGSETDIAIGDQLQLVVGMAKVVIGFVLGSVGGYVAAYVVAVRRMAEEIGLPEELDSTVDWSGSRDLQELESWTGRRLIPEQGSSAAERAAPSEDASETTEAPPEPLIDCPACGGKVHAGLDNCQWCGEPLAGAPSVEASASPEGASPHRSESGTGQAPADRSDQGSAGNSAPS